MTTSIKLYAACLLLHPVIDGLLSIKKECKTNPEDIQSVQLEVAPLCLAVTDNPIVRTGMEGKFSIHFCSALALIRGKVGSHDFLADSLNDPKIWDMMNKIKVKANPDLKETEAKITVYASRGSVNRKQVSSPKGDPANPVSFKEIVEKFEDLNQDKLSKKKIREIIACVRELESLSDIRRLMALLCSDMMKS
jgi:2-methylcitrate dehydratase PrpD